MFSRPRPPQRAWCQVLRGGPGALKNVGPGPIGPGPAAKYVAPSTLGRRWSREHGYRLHIPMFFKTRSLF